MNKSIKRISSILLATVVSAGITAGSGINSTMNIMAAETSSYSIIGEDSKVFSDIKIGDKDTGVDYTTIHLGSGGEESYGANRIINIVEANLSNTNLSFEVINHGTYTTDEAPLTEVVEGYVDKKKADGKTLLATVNGDWMHWVNGTDAHNMNVGATKNYRVPTGVTIIDGEILNSHITSQEVAYDGPHVFGVTKSNQPVIGLLKVDTTLKINGKDVAVNGINRAPARNAIYIYNERLYDSNYVPSDAYELFVKTDGTNKFRNGEEITGTIEAIYPARTETRSPLKDGYLIITARGDKKIPSLSEFKVGDKVSVTATLRDDIEKNNELWKNVNYALGGHFLLMQDGVPNKGYSTNHSQYPSNIIGFKDDGTVMMAMVTADENGKYHGLKFSQMAEFCQEIGYNTCFLFDGGGSTTMITLEADSYVERACYSDGHIRNTWNSLALFYNETPVCEKQGDLNHIQLPIVMNPTDLKFEAGMAPNFSGANSSKATFTEDTLRLSTSSKSKDPFISLDFSSCEPKINADEYKYLAVKYRTTENAKTNTFKMYLCAGDVTAATEESAVSFTMNTDGAWQTAVIDISSVSKWSGILNSIRLDFFDGEALKGETVEFANWGFTKTKAEADALANDFSARTVLAPELEPIPTEAPTEAPTKAPTEAPAGEPSETNAATDIPAASNTKSGCGSIIGSSLGMIVISGFSAAIVAFARKKSSKK